MLQELVVAHAHAETARKAAENGDTKASLAALAEATAMRDEISRSLLKLDADLALLERDVGLRLHGEGSPWREGMKRRTVGLQPEHPNVPQYLRGWEIADRLMRYSLTES